MKTVKQVNGTRIRTFFAWFPITICKDGYETTRWLETVTVEERFFPLSVSPAGTTIGSSWRIIKFID